MSSSRVSYEIHKNERQNFPKSCLKTANSHLQCVSERGVPIELIRHDERTEMNELAALKT